MNPGATVGAGGTGLTTTGWQFVLTPPALTAQTAYKYKLPQFGVAST